MGRVSDKKSRLYDEKNRRMLYRRFELENQDVPRGYLVFSLLLIPVCIMSGVVVADYQYLFSLDSYEESTKYNYSIGNYSIMFVRPGEVEDMKGNWGFTYNYRNGDIFINKQLLKNNRFDVIRETCRHELLHELGIPSKHHDRIDRFEEVISDPVCDKLMERVREVGVMG